MQVYRVAWPIAVFGLLALSSCAAAEPSSGKWWTRWRVKNMRYCSGRAGQVVFDGVRSTVSVSKEKPCSLAHTNRYTDLVRDRFVLTLGKVSPGVRWELNVRPSHGDRKPQVLMKGTGGGTHTTAFSRLAFPRWLATDIDLQIRSDEPGTIEIIGWEVQAPGVDPWAAKQVEAYRLLAKGNPLERGLVPHWNTEIGAFVCAFNSTHPEHYNYWLEDTGEMLWSFGNYPELMQLYGKGLRDFIVEHCKMGAPVRRVNDQPLIIYEPPVGGKFCYDTGPMVVEGELANDPRVNLHHGTYEMDTIATIAGFYVAYEDAQGAAHRLDFAKPESYDVQFDVPKRDGAELVIRATEGLFAAEFTIVGYRGGVRLLAKVRNRAEAEIKNVTAGFELRGCEKYYRSPLNRLSQFGDVAIVWSEQPRMEFCNFVRIEGPAARSPKLERKGENIARAEFPIGLSSRMPKGGAVSLEIANVQAASRSFAEKIEMYKDIDFENADISVSFVSTYALLGLATYSYRYPDDTEARQVVDLMIDNFYGARERLRNRELGYLMWTLSLLGKDTEANVIADLIEKRAATEKYTPLDMAGMAIGLRKVGRWEAADKVCLNLDKAWDGVACPADYLGLGAQQSPKLTRRCLGQLSQGLRCMVWDAPDRLTFHSSPLVEEAAEEAQSYTLIEFELISRTNGGIVPVRLSLEPASEITRLAFDEKTGESTIGLAKAGEIDIFTTYRKPGKVLWNGKPLDTRNWRYDAKAGVIRLTGLSGDGELTLSVIGPRPKDKWTPIDYVGPNKR